MKCAACGDPLPSGKKASARYCDDECRGDAARNRARNRARRAKKLSSQRSFESTLNPPNIRKQIRTPETLASDNVLVISSLESPKPQRRTSKSATVHPASFRMDIKEQVLRQALPNAVGYGIVLPACSSDARPKIIPRRKKGEPRTPYRLSPFDYPLDIRLRDGIWYRLLWFGNTGALIPPTPDSGIPSLYFFLGTPDQAELREALSKQQPSLLTASATELMRSLPVVVTETKAESVSTVVSATVSETLSAMQDGMGPASPEAVGLAQQSPSAQSPQTESPAEQRSALDVGNERNDALLSAAASGKYHEKLHRFWLEEGKCLLHVESLAQLLYEQRLVLVKEQGVAAPSEPLTQLSGDERMKIRRIARHPTMIQAGRALVAHISSAEAEGIGVLDALPLNIESRSPSEQQMLLDAQKHPEKREYLEYRFRRVRTLLAGTPPPLEPRNSLSSPERKRLTKVVLDLRSMSTAVPLSGGDAGH